MNPINKDLHEVAEVKSKVGNVKEGTSEYRSLSKLFERMSSHFRSKYDIAMQDILFNIYDDLCPDDKIESIDHYLAEHYSKGKGGFDAPMDEGVLVHVDDFSFGEGRLVLLPDPARIVLQDANSSFRETLWQAPN